MSLDNARANLAAELPEQDLAVTAAAASDAWLRQLRRIRIAGGTERERRIFYTSLYHLLQMPTTYSDANGEFRGFDGQTRSAFPWVFHSDLSLWDTYRTAHPAYDLFFPEKAADFAQSLVWMAESGGAFPRWPVAGGEGGSMIGQPHAIALADAWVKGVTDWDLPGAWPTLVAQARGELAATYNAMPGVADLDTLRYLPSDRYGGSVAWTQELAWADWSLAQIASSVGDAENAAYLAWRSRGYRELYDPAMGFFHARASDGTFATELDPFAWADEYVEGNAWQYLWLAPHDAEGLAALLGGEDAARARLDEFFDGAVAEGLTDWPGTYYWHGNEPDLHAAWLYALWGDPASTVERVDWILDTLYDDQPAGLAGNDDGGTLSAWYLFATIGFYPIAGSTSYVLGVPRFPLVEIDRPDGVLVVRRDGTGVPERVEVDGEVLDGPVIRHPALAGGSVVRFVGRGD